MAKSSQSPAQRWTTLVVMAVFAALLLSLGLPALVYELSLAAFRGESDAAWERSHEALHAASVRLGSVRERVQPAIVVVRSQPASRGFPERTGMGVLVDHEGHIVTTYSLIHNPLTIAVTLPEHRSPFPAELLGFDPESDLALIRIQTNGMALLPASLGDSSQVHVGNWVLAIAEDAQHGRSASMAMIKTIVDESLWPTFHVYALNQTALSGFLIDQSGHIVAMATHRRGGGDYTSYTPSNFVVEAIADFKQYGRLDRGWIGLFAHDHSSGHARELEVPNAAAFVDYVVPGSVAESVGIRAGDIVFEAGDDQRAVTSAEYLHRKVYSARPGSRLRLLILRKEEIYEFVPIVQHRPKTPVCLPGEREWRVVFECVTPQLARRLGYRSFSGVMVRSVESGVCDGLLFPGDVITKLNSKPVTNIDSFCRRLLDMNLADAATLEVYSVGLGKMVAVEIPAARPAE